MDTWVTNGINFGLRHSGTGHVVKPSQNAMPETSAAPLQEDYYDGYDGLRGRRNATRDVLAKLTTMVRDIHAVQDVLDEVNTNVGADALLDVTDRALRAAIADLNDGITNLRKYVAAG